MTTRTGFLIGTLMSGVLLTGFWTADGDSAEPGYRALGSASLHVAHAGCRDVLAELEAEWDVTQQWRALAPVPAPREASPTNVVGTWVERRHLDSNYTELQRVSTQRTDIALVDGASCTVRRTSHVRRFNSDSLQNALTDARLDSLMRQNGRGMLYVWSPRMPLSVDGIAQARAAAKQLGVAFTAMVAETNDEELSTLSVGASDTWRMESLELVYRNATIHYPSALFYDSGHIVDGAYPGYKNTATYVLYAKRQFAAPNNGAPSPSALIDALLADAVPADALPASAPKFWVDHKARVTPISSVNTVRRIGFFFKPIAGTDLVSYTSNNRDYFFNVKTGEEIQVPGHVDPVPTPDGRFLTLPGLLMYPVPALLAGNQVPMHTDRALPDEYQTASILSESASNIRYRVVTGWNAGARFRDYDVALDQKRTPVSITSLAEPFAPCGDRLLTLPINAKSGTEFGAFDAIAKTNLVLDVTDPSHCAVKLDLGFASGKLSFSYDGASIAFATSRINTNAEGELLRPSELMFKDALVLERKTGRIVSLSQNEPIGGMTFPEFQKDGSVMLLDQVGPGRAVERLRVVRYK